MKSSTIETNEEDQQITFIYRRAKLKYRLSEDIITKPDLLSLSKALLDSTEEEAQNQFIQLQELFLNKKDKSAQLNLLFLTKETVNRLNSSNSIDNLTPFFEKFYLSLLTKSESIVYRLKNLSKCNWVTKKNNLKASIDYILTTITEGDLYDIDNEEISKHVTAKVYRKQEIKPLMQYSQIETKNQREKDVSFIRSNTRKYTNAYNQTNGSISGLLKKRRSTNLSTMVSPSIIARLYTQLSRIDQTDFNIFDLDDIIGKKTTIFLAKEILSKCDVVEQEMISPDILNNFITEIVDYYDRVNAIYHNDLHAGDVMQTLYTMLIRGNLIEKMQLSQLDLFASLIASLCHDYKHPGQNNLFHINSKSPISLKYNDISVLENYHLAQTFKVLSHSRKNIYINFTPEEYRICRKRMVEGVIATDMANHQKVLLWVKTNSESYNIKKGQNFEKIFQQQNNNMSKLFDAQQGVLNFLIHTADISNPGKPNKISENWTRRVYDEFFIQGDKEREKGLPISQFCDRKTTDINKAMIGFISFVVGPTIDILVNLIYEVGDYRDYCKANLKKYQMNVKREEKKK